MIASDRVRLDGLIHQWEEEALQEYREAADRLRADVVAPANLSYHTAKARQNSLTRCAQQLRAALLVLGDTRDDQSGDISVVVEHLRPHRKGQSKNDRMGTRLRKSRAPTP